ncbi:MAG TPA: helix-turn-helix transcriptional regulator, partial [Thermoanaerobaculia bacterium]|nr:helix-turn-helix transcriptional regulator [Thermoanaerobaculia bacterium]
SRAMIALYRAFRDGESLAVDEILHDVSAPAFEVRQRRCVPIALEALHADPPPRFADIAREAGVTPAYLARAFRRATGQTMGEYLRGLRAKRAASLLASTFESLADVALTTGFADQSHLCRVFRAQYGITPLRYRALMRSTAFKT